MKPFTNNWLTNIFWYIFLYYAMHMVHSLIFGIYITRIMILGSARVLITDQCSSWLFNCNIAMSKIFGN